MRDALIEDVGSCRNSFNASVTGMTGNSATVAQGRFGAGLVVKIQQSAAIDAEDIVRVV
jgi:hypothetical protein